MSRIYEYYDVAGGAEVTTSGFPSVFQYDPSTFYNYTQDNFAATGLEARDLLLSQETGFPADASSYSGVTLTVSASPGGPVPADFLGLYSSVQQAVDSLPRVLTYPVLIEVCEYGNLGTLSIVGIKCEGEGALQITIINQGSAPDGMVSSISTIDYFGASTTYVREVNSSGLFSQITAASSSKFGVNTYDLPSWNTYAQVYAQRGPDSQRESEALSFADGQFGPYSLAYEFSTGPNTVNASHYADGYTFYDDSVRYDIRPTTQDTSQDIMNVYRKPPQVGNQASVVAYGSHFSSVTIKDSNKIKLKGVCVDSAQRTNVSQFLYSTTYNEDDGLTIENSEVLLEDVAISRCRLTGLKAVNSTVLVTKSFVVHRIYTKDDLYPIAWSGTRGTGVFLQDSNLVFDTSSVENGGRYMRYLSKCGTGLYAVNSFIGGGSRNTLKDTSYTKNAGDSDTITSHLQASQNDVGFKLQNSVLEFDGRLGAFLNLRGVDSKNSRLVFPQLSVDDNQNEGFRLDNSVLSYGKYADEIIELGGFSGGSYNAPLFHCDFNGVNVKASNNSTVGVDHSVVGFSSVGMWGGNTSLSSFDSGETAVSGNYLMRSHGTESTVTSVRSPAIVAENNSNVTLVGLGFIGDGISAISRGACAYANNNSNLTFIGFGDTRWTNFTTYGDIDTSARLHRNWESAAFVAKNNSRIEFNGPTKISKIGVDVLCEDNSQVYFGPPLEGGLGLFGNKDKYGLGEDDNHTKVELHSTRSCLVANDSSKITLYGLGASAAASSTAFDTDASSLFYTLTKGGYAFMFPNGYTANAVNDASAQINGTALWKYTRKNGFSPYLSFHPSGSTGGMCVRAVDDSDVEIDLVNFKFGLTSSSVSGAFYNWYGSGLEYDGRADGYTPESDRTDRCWYVDLCCDCEPTTTYTGAATTTTTAPSTATSTTISTIHVVTGTLSPTTTPLPPPPTTRLTSTTSTAPITTTTATIIETTTSTTWSPTSTTSTTSTVPITTSTATIIETTTSTTWSPTSTTSTTAAVTLATSTTTTTIRSTTSTTSSTSTSTTSTAPSTHTHPPSTSSHTPTYTTTTSTTWSPTPTETSTTTTLSPTDAPVTTTSTEPTVTVPEFGGQAMEAEEGPGMNSKDMMKRGVSRGKNFNFIYQPQLLEYSGFGSRIQIWNICDTSRFRATNLMLNGLDPELACVNENFHGPTGRWWNGATCDYYGRYGLYAFNQYVTNSFYNYGIFRLMVGGRGSLKSMYSFSYNGAEPPNPIASEFYGGGTPFDQLGAQGYQAATDLARSLPNTDITSAMVVNEDFGAGRIYSGLQNVFGQGLAGYFREPGKLNGLVTHAPMVEGYGMVWDYGQLHPQFSLPPLHLKWGAYLDNILDESAVNLFANAKHAANKKVGLCSVYKSYTPPTSGGEGRDGEEGLGLTFGLGVRSLNIFELSQLV